MSTPRTGVLFVVAVAIVSVIAASCGSDPSLDPNLGGGTTRDVTTRNAFGLPAPTLTNEERRIFEIGDSFFTQNWVTAPASTDARDGLGPTFNAQACSSCHGLDGRGFPPDLTGEDARLGLLLRLSIPGTDETGAPLPDPNYGGQLQDRAVLDGTPEGSVVMSVETIDGTYDDGEPFQLGMPSFDVEDLAFGPLADDIMISPRLAPQVIGMGLLEAIPAEAILEHADPDDADGDGISGRPNMVWDVRLSDITLGRFGWKANVSTVEQQVAGAFHGDIGITSSLFPDENCPEVQASCAAAPNGNDEPKDGESEDSGELELTNSRLGSITFYNRTLAIPAMRNPTSAAVVEGASQFEAMGCAGCHTPTFTTGSSDILALENQTIHPYTDLLLHDMGPGLADGRPDFDATGTEWRTPPLWGIGLIETVNGERFLLHDGRASTLEEAILWHGGEAETSKEAFRMASKEQRDALIAFLEAL